MNILRAAIGIVALALIGVTIWAALAQRELHGDFFEQAQVLLTLPWGVAGLAGLIAASALFAVLVFLTERSWVLAALWAAPVLVLGQAWAAIWLAIRLPHLAKQLSKPDWPTS